jgi:hypothetical protein
VKRIRLPAWKVAGDDAVFVAGWLMMTVGLGLWQLPAGLIGGGVVLLVVWAIGAMRWGSSGKS